MGQDKRVPDRSPDVVEAITDEQLCKAIGDWLAANGRMAAGAYSATTVQLSGTGSHTFKARREGK